MSENVPNDADLEIEPGQETLGSASSPGSDNTEKDPSQWVTGDDPMTGAQKSYLNTLATQAGEELPADLNKAEASEQIGRLKSKVQSGDS